jgi:hypothetical protein
MGAQLIGALLAASPSAAPTPSSTAGTGSSSDTVGTVTVPPNAPYGIPCVY